MDTKQIIEALTSEDSMRYIQLLAQDFATKAAEHFVDQIRNKEREIAMDSHISPPKPPDRINKIQDRTKKNLLDESEAMNLIDEPPPDGDNLDLNTYELSEEEAQKKIPVVEVMKVNGRYFRRVLGMI